MYTKRQVEKRLESLQYEMTLEEMRKFLSEYTSGTRSFDGTSVIHNTTKTTESLTQISFSNSDVVEAVVILQMMEDYDGIFMIPTDKDIFKLLVKGMFKLMLYNVLEASHMSNKILVYKDQER